MTTQDANKVFKRYEGLIKWVAKKNHITGHPTMDFEEIQSECYLVMAKCLNVVDGNNVEEFDRFFKVSMYNRVKDMWRYVMRDSNGHRAIHIDLSDVYESVGVNGFRELLIKDEVRYIRTLLSDLSRKVFDCAIEPDDDLLRLAIIDHLRKKHVAYQNGIMMKENFRVMKRHIAERLGVTNSAVSWCVNEIRDILDRSELLRPAIGLK